MVWCNCPVLYHCRTHTGTEIITGLLSKMKKHPDVKPISGTSVRRAGTSPSKGAAKGKMSFY